MPSILSTKVIPLLAGLCCAAAIAAPTPDYEYPLTNQGEDVGITIAMLHPDLRLAEDVGEIPGYEVELPPYENTQWQYRGQVKLILLDYGNIAEDVNAIYREAYQTEFENAVAENIGRLFTARGFQASGDLEGMAALDTEDRQDVMLTSIPSATLSFMRNVDSRECVEDHCTETGELLLEGQFLYQLVEPVTGSAVAINRLNVHNLGIRHNYVVETRGDETLRDTRVEAVAISVQELHDSIVTKIDEMISRDQLVALVGTIQDLKSGDVKLRER
ncbi:hypothetical protein [Spectribacter hydrogenoxidans]|uniref:Uncharacterized protein n=1 Tax=Spectribacter hydrogenoxidans TaxID=3075608 RepID=A0ABU3BZ48_9GAMM|nr:hypothetical protein [Salinisphaera sp. W335]MDT0634573.1 hypothetical protein [Salinisphaera sp. W335]